MRSGLNSSRKKHGLLVRGVALFFLLFTGADLTMPQYFCGEEMAGQQGRAGSSVLASNLPEKNEVAIAAPDSRNSTPGQPSDQEPHEEDCFCCCAHLLLSLDFSCDGTPELTSPSTPLSSDSLPSPPLQVTYHPPRFA